MPELEKRTWVYVQQPKQYDIPLHSCGHPDPEWSEWKGHLWCPQCQVDFVPEHWGVLDGPVGVYTATMLGLCFDQIDIATGEIIPFEPGRKALEDLRRWQKERATQTAPAG